MTRVFLADPLIEERSALRAMLMDLSMDVVGEATDWGTLSKGRPGNLSDMVLFSWDLIPKDASWAISKLRKTYPGAILVTIANRSDLYERTALNAGLDVFISKEISPRRVAELISSAVKFRKVL
jgi:DNA-binding NarL/FixJ family response regulator